MVAPLAPMLRALLTHIDVSEPSSAIVTRLEARIQASITACADEARGAPSVPWW